MEFATQRTAAKAVLVALAVGLTGCSDHSMTDPLLEGGLVPNYGASGVSSSVTFTPGNTSDPGASASASIAALQAAAQGVGFKLRIRGDVFTRLQRWDSRTLMSIDDGTYANRKVELVTERDDRDQVRISANWSNGVVVQTAFIPVASIQAAGEYVIYGHYNDAGSPQRELTLFSGDGTELQRSTAFYAAGPLSTAAGNGVLHVARGLHNWSSNGTIDGVALYVFSGGTTLAGAARSAPPSAADPGIVSLTGFDEGSGTTAANAVPGAPSLVLQNPQWVTGGSWSGSAASSVASGPSSAPAPGGAGLATFAPGNSSTPGAVATGSIAALEQARQGIAVKLRVKGDVFTNLGPWDSRTLLSISDGTYAGRKLELVLERDDQSRVHLRSRWARQEIQTQYGSVGAFDPARYYVIYTHYNDGASPQREVAVFDDGGSTVQIGDQPYAAGDLPAPAGSGSVALASGLGNWSANGTIDGVAIYVFPNSSVLSGSARYSAPSAADPGIVSLVDFGEGSGTTAGNAVAGSPGMTVPGNSWMSGGTWDATASTTPVPAPIVTAPAPIEPSGPATILFSDDFSSGDLSRTGNGWAWTDGSYVDVVRGFSKDGNTGNSARFTFLGTSSPSGDAWAELRFRVGTANLKDLWATFWIYYPSGRETIWRGPRFEHRYAAGEATNNKFFRLFDQYDTGYMMYGAQTWTDATAGGDGYLIPDRRDQSGLTQMYWDTKVPWETDANRGRWMKVEFHTKAASAFGVADGVFQIYKDGAAVVDVRNVDGFESLGENIWKQGYLLGWADSGFSTTSYVYISNVTFSTGRLP